MEIAEARLLEAETLFQAKHYAGAVYLGGYAVECFLKVAICVRLEWDALRGTFKTHDLEGLLLYSGLDRTLRTSRDIVDSFGKIVQIWAIEASGNNDGRRSVRYQRPTDIDEQTARRFLEYVANPSIGVVPWLRGRIS